MATPERAGPAVQGVTEAGAHAEAQRPTGRAEFVVVAPKLRIPSRRRELVSRARLLHALTAGPPARLTLIEAAPGWGKTTLLTEWSAGGEPDRPFAWVSLDRGDNDPVRFWTYVIQALRGVDPLVGTSSLPLVRAHGTSVSSEVLPLLVNELSTLSRRVVLVLDDYHAISNGEIHEGMAFLLDHLPEPLHVVIATRSAPPLPVARSRARGELLEIRAEQLRFTDDEAAALLNDVLEIGIDPSDVSRLQERTEGWPAGLYLAALSMRGGRDPHEFTEAFAGDDRHIVDYLSTEVLDRQPPELRTFMLRTSILEGLCGPLCDEVTGGRSSAHLLEELERANLFLISLDTRRRWYRYHHLFAELLRHELGRLEPELVATLHNRAAAWYAKDGAIPAAIRHATLGGDFERASELIATYFNAHGNQGRLETVAGWLDALPEPVVSGDPRLSLAWAFLALYVGRLDDVDAWLELAHRGALEAPGTALITPSIEARYSLARAMHRYFTGSMGEAGEAAGQAMAREPDHDSSWYALAGSLAGGVHYWQGELDAAAARLERMSPAAGASEAAWLVCHRADPGSPICSTCPENNFSAIFALGYMAATQLDRGRLAEAERLVRIGTERSQASGIGEHYVNDVLHLTRGRLLERQGKLREAEGALVHALELSRRGPGRMELVASLVALAQVRRALGAGESSRALLGEARQVIGWCPDPAGLEARLVRAERGAAQPGAPSPRVKGAHQPGSLTGRELAVLRLLPGDLSLREIGATLFLSLNTVKTHTRGIYGKLQVATRAEAVARAQEAGLLPPSRGEGGPPGPEGGSKC
jgi:LuxR family maltose regulon positive regulatory protein